MPDDLEKLFEQATLPAEPLLGTSTHSVEPNEPISTDLECKHCLHATRLICPTCKGPFCTLHASVMNKDYCSLCLSEPILTLKELPLKDSEGVTHEGRVLIPLEPSFQKLRFGTLSKTISEMTLIEVESYIDYYKHLIKQAEITLDTRRVIIGSLQIEHAQRKDAERRVLRADKRKYPVKTVAVGKDGEKKTSLAGLIKLMEMMKALEASQKSKTASAPATPVAAATQTKKETP